MGTIKYYCREYNSAGNHIFKVNNRNIRTSFKIYSQLAIKTSERRLASFWCISEISLQVHGLRHILLGSIHYFLKSLFSTNCIQISLLALPRSNFSIALQIFPTVCPKPVDRDLKQHLICSFQKMPCKCFKRAFLRSVSEIRFLWFCCCCCCCCCFVFFED